MNYALFKRTARLDLLEEVVALVINEDEGREVFYFNLPDGLHAEFGILNALNALDVVLSEDSGWSSNGAQIKAAMLLASIGNGL